MHPRHVREEALRLLTEEGLSLSEVGRRLRVSRAALREWRENGPGPEGDGCPGHLTSPAYAALLGYYLGDGCLSRAPRTVALRVSCDARYPGIIADVTALIAEVHPTRPVFHVRAPGVVVVQGCWKHWPCLFPQHGPGRKHTRDLVLADWQRAVVEEHPGDFLRGLFHSDGARVRNWASRTVGDEQRRWYYPRWHFVNHSEDILGFCTDALDLAGVAWRRSGRFTISVSRRADVARLDELVGPKR